MAEASYESPEQESKRNSLEVNNRLPADCLQGQEPGARGWYVVVQMFVYFTYILQQWFRIISQCPQIPTIHITVNLVKYLFENGIRRLSGTAMANVYCNFVFINEL
jgi:hypothetical protein